MNDRDRIKDPDQVTRPVGPRASSIPTPLTPGSEGGPALVISMPRAPSAESIAATAREPTPVERALRVPGARGVAFDDGAGHVEHAGSVDAAFAARAAYFLELARILASELGLEDLRAMAVTSRSRRVVTVTRGDGAAHVVGDRDLDAAAVTKAVTP